MKEKHPEGNWVKETIFLKKKKNYTANIAKLEILFSMYKYM